MKKYTGLAAILTLLLAACPDPNKDTPSGGGGGEEGVSKYTAAIFAVSSGDFEAVFGPGSAPADFMMALIAGEKAALIEKVLAARAKPSLSPLESGTGLSFETVKNTVIANKTTMEINDAEITTLMSELSSKGYSVGVINLTGPNAGKIGIAAAYKE